MSTTNEGGSVAVVTGGTSGIGRLLARDLAADGMTVAVVGRSEARGTKLVAEADGLPGTIRFHRTDLAMQAAVRSLAEELSATYDRIDALVHNAGCSSHARVETEDGIELTLAVNHLAPYLLTHELLDGLVASAPARIVVTASGIHTRATLRFDDLGCEREYDALDAYARSKLANVAFTLELAERLPVSTDVTVNCVHPGFIPSTNLFRDASLRTRLLIRAASLAPGVGTTTREGADRLRSLVTDPAYGERTGTYVTGDGPTSPSAEAADQAVRERLWEVSADLVGVDPDWP
ncbi:SDR family NAD(P)-dependent oxidoreductase [Halorubrum vacuolatum]|uniref:NAD(P)-dependent dehydrogenase, short-chain alcohol dehydrogenase family n=1 Tax=Halorubrum vacuolatum TaxID=63740 RepID=A0A238XAZ8_HALVU|nr:SDR family NAD(P)-dependent oxidoreductase [Halorubrum vacuolatum]SNR56216.1 NAD(P)-dependent dehydrogenase, short-chain alcohol dehydrogenase family [Halorubrum vacuolatum]